MPAAVAAHGVRQRGSKRLLTAVTCFPLTFACGLVFFNDPATTEIYTLSLHDALPISGARVQPTPAPANDKTQGVDWAVLDRKSTRLNSSHLGISYAVFCLKKKKT